MGHCPNCNLTLDKGLLLCPHCGEQLIQDKSTGESLGSQRDFNSDTVDFQPKSKRAFASLDAKATDLPANVSDQAPTPDESRLEADPSSTVDFSADSEALEEQETESSTIDWDGASTTQQDTANATVEFEETDASTIDAAHLHAIGESTVDFAQKDSQAEAAADVIPDTVDDANKTIELAGKNELTVDADPEELFDEVSTVDLSDPAIQGNATVELHGKGDATVDLAHDDSSDEAATIDIQPPPESGGITVEFLGKSELTVHADHDSLNSGTSGKNSDEQTTHGNATVEFMGKSDQTVGADEDHLDSDAMTIDQSPSHDEPVKPTQSGSRRASGRTANINSQDTAHATYRSDSLGTEDKLHRMWDGVAGASKNPMHSLQGLGLVASDTVFERVATRRVTEARIEQDTHADYQIIKKLGEGAMGIVYSARQIGVNRIVALKTAKPNYQKNDESRRRFLYEAHITADLDHSNIVPIHELGSSEEGNLFYAMKLVQGTEWSRVIRKKTREENLEIFLKVADAMAFAHSKGVIHRDLKPENTMLGKYGEVFVTDWGTAINIKKDSSHLASPIVTGDKFLNVVDGRGFAKNDALALHDGEVVLERIQIKQIDPAQPNRIHVRKAFSQDYQPSENLQVLKVMNLAGTPCFMAPEMAGHKLPKIGTRSDIYILGAILYEIVTGKAPHRGSSVTECLQAALTNDIIRSDYEDALLTIAYKAMATEPKDRYQTVEDLQEALREYRRHAESVALANRSEELLTRAIEKSDYKMFSRTLFGFQDAVELWPDNGSAVAGLQKARLAFGNCAFGKGDYDLVLQTVDRRVADEAALYSKAIDAKQKSEGRESKLKLLQKAIAAVVLLAVVGLSGLSIYALNQSARATLAAKKEKIEREKAVQLAEEKVLLAESEKEAKNIAVLAQKAAEKSALSEESAKNEALAAKQRAEDSAASETVAKNLALQAQKSAEEATQRELVAKNEAIQAANLAKLRAAQIQLGEYNSSLALAKSQIESFDVAAGRQSLNRLKNLKSDVFFGQNPDFDTWGLKRISLLSNADLPTTQIAGNVTASTYAPQSQLAVIGTSDGLIQVLRILEDRLEPAEQYIESGANIHAMAISPDGLEVVYGFTRNQSHSVHRWVLGQENSQPVVAAQQRLFQRIAFSGDGNKLLAGINGGIWVWDRVDHWFDQTAPSRRVTGIRGELESLQAINAQEALLVVRFQDSMLLGVLDLTTGNTNLITLPDGLDNQLTSAAHTLVDDTMLLGLSDNRLLVGKLDRSANTLVELTQLEDKHRAPVTQIVTNGTGQLITVSSDEPVAHVWHFVDQTLQYDTFLTGTPNNLAGLGMLATNRVLGVDVDGTSIVWDVQRQQQRRRLERQSQEAGQSATSQDYVSPVQGVFPGRSDVSALAIDENGVVDLWSLVDGSTQKIGSNRWSYIGHTPGVELVDSAVDLQRGIVVTAASLRNAERKYLAQPDHDWEFCIWDQASGGMIRRWTAANRQITDAVRPESIEQRISLVDRGQKILYASDSETRLVELASGNEVFVRPDFGSYFAVPNPQSPSMLMLVKRSGAVKLFDLDDETSWDDASNRNFALADPSDIPLRGIWSEDGTRFYLTFSSGGLAVLDWMDGQLKLLWSSRRLDGEIQSAGLREVFSAQTGRAQSHLDIDLLVAKANHQEILYVATRHRGQDASTRLVALGFGPGRANPEVIHMQRAEGIQWLEDRGTMGPVLSAKIHDVLMVDNKRIRSRLSLGSQTFVSTGSAQVFGLVEGQTRSISYGRSALVSATGGRDGKSIFALLADGAIWKFSLSDNAAPDWQRLSYDALDASKIDLSPSGKQLVIQALGAAKLVQAHDGVLLQDLGELSATTWDAGAGDRLALCRSDGQLELFEDGKFIQLAQAAELPKSDRIKGLHFLMETWSDAKNQTRQHLLVQTENDQHGNLQIVPIEPVGEKEQNRTQIGAENPVDLLDKAPVTRTQVPKGTLVSTSPKEGILVTGTPSGTVTVWFAAPTWERSPRQLFDLEGHRGASVTCLGFSSDGRTLISADNENRLYAWLSEDPTLHPNAMSD